MPAFFLLIVSFVPASIIPLGVFLEGLGKLTKSFSCFGVKLLVSKFYGYH